MSIPAEPSLFQYEVQVFNSKACKSPFQGGTSVVPPESPTVLYVALSVCIWSSAKCSSE